MANKGAINGDDVLKGVVERIQAVDSEFKKLLTTYDDLSKKLTQTNNVSGVDAVVKQTNAANEKQIATLIKLERLQKEKSNAVIQAAKAENAVANETAANIQKEANARKAVSAAKSAQVTLDNKIATQANKTNSYYKQQSTLLNKLRDTYKSLELKKQQGIALTSKEAITYTRLSVQVKALDGSLKQADAAAGQFNRHVGNYAIGVKGLATSFRSLVGAFGFTSGIFLFASIIKDTVTRVREFDKSMQNLAGVLGTTRGQIKPIEKEILAVAGASIKTSREVAQLAEVLATLGLKGLDLQNLIEPTNNLSIALNATSDEAGEFLVQTLNAFGESSSKAEEYANTITAIRTSTSLDFQKMRDSFQYLTSINNLLGNDLATTGAQIGILADNGLKAESAGRLLATGLQKLAKEGRTLESALDEINKAQEQGIEGYDLLAVASKLFGAQAGKIGIILANNTDKVKENAQAIRENGDAMDKLVDQQLESLDAKIGLLNASWESLILSIDNGTGAVSKFMKTAIDGINIVLKGLQRLNENREDVRVKIAPEIEQQQFKAVLKQIEEETGGDETKIKLFIESNFDEETQSFNKATNELEYLTQRLEDVEKLKKDSSPFGTDTLKYSNEIFKLNGLIDEQTEKLQQSSGSLRAFAKYTDVAEPLQLLNDELEDLDGKNGGLGKDTKNLIEGSVKAYQELIKKLTELRDGTATSATEWKEYDEQIALVERSITRLQGGLDSLQKVTGINEYLNYTFDPVPKGADPVEIQEGITLQIAKEKERERELINAINQGKLEDTRIFVDKEVEAIEAGLEMQRELQATSRDAIEDLVVGGLDTVFQARIDNIDKELDANQTQLDTILNSTTASDEQKLIAQQKFDKEQIRLQKEKEKREKQAFLVSQGLALAEIAINLAKTISAITAIAAALPANIFTLGGAAAAYTAANIPVAVGIAAAQAGLVLAQSIPAFFRGKDANDDYEGLATVGEKRKEVIIGGDGSIEVTPNKTTKRFIKSDDIIVPSLTQFDRQVKDPSSDVSKRLAQRLTKDTANRQNMITVNNSTDTKGIETAIGRAMAKHKPPVFRPNIIVSQPKRTKY